MATCGSFLHNTTRHPVWVVRGLEYRTANITVIASKAVVGAIPDIGTAR